MVLSYASFLRFDRGEGRKKPPKGLLKDQRRLLLFLFRGVMDDFLAIIVATFRANVMGRNHSAAMRASDKPSHFELEVSAP
jgi:hypothetical protein